MNTLNRRQFAGAVAAGTLPFFVAFRGRTQPARAITAPDAALLERLPKLMDVTGVPGLAAAVIRDGRLIWQKYEGVSEAGTSRLISAETMFPAASLGKPVFAYAALRLVEEGKLDLERPLKEYVPDHAPVDPRGDKVTARHVLSHSSGFRNWRNASQPLVPEFDPGTRFQYSGEGFYYLQRAVEKVTGGAFEQFMVARLFEPFAMKSSTYAWRSDTDARLVLGHRRGNVVNSQSRDFANRLFLHAERQGRSLARFTHDDVIAAMAELNPAPRALPNFMLPNAAASLLTTLPDYAAFLIRVLAPTRAAGEIATATRRQMLSSVTKINSALSWGLGWGLEHDGEHEYVWHWGDNGNFKNFVLLHLPTRSAVVVFTNATHGMRVAEAIVDSASGIRHLAFDWL